MRLFNFKTKNKPIENLAFIFGCPRSGTTFLWSLLESHESVMPFLLNYNKVDGKYLTSESGIYIKEPRMAKKKLLKIAQKNPRKLIIEKTPSHSLKHKTIIKDFPHGKYILIFRNPLAIVNSMVRSDMEAFINHDTEKAILEVKKYYKQLIQFYNTNISFVLTYEALYNETKSELDRTLKYLNLSNNNTDNIIKSCKDKVKVNVYGALRKADPFSYKTELNGHDINLINHQLKDEILFFKALRS
jgi:hypothetical protein